MTNGFRSLKGEVRAYVKGVTAGEVPLLFGIASDALSTGNINGALTQLGPTGRVQTEEEDIAERPIWILGEFGGEGPVGNAQVEGYFKNKFGGNLIEFNLRWTFPKPNGWAFFIFNDSGAALTTGASVTVKGKQWGVWVG